MELTTVPTIIIICYLIGEIYKVVFKKKKKIYCLLPPIITIIGGVLGVIIYITNKEMIAFASNIWMALEIGLISGASSTGANQIIKQILKSKGENKDEWI